MELDELFELKRNIEEEIQNFFKGNEDGNIHYGDRNYQWLLERLNEVQEKIDEISENDNK